MVIPWESRGKHMKDPLGYFISMEIPWNYGVAIGLPWDLHGTSIGQYYHVIPTVLWCSHWTKEFP